MKAHKLLYHSTLGSRVRTKKKSAGEASAPTAPPAHARVPPRPAAAREANQPATVQEQLLSRNVERFRAGLVLKAHKLLCHSTLGMRVIKRKERGFEDLGSWFCGSSNRCPPRHKSRVERLKAKVEPLSTQVTMNCRDLGSWFCGSSQAIMTTLNAITWSRVRFEDLGFGLCAMFDTVSGSSQAIITTLNAITWCRV